MLNSRGNIFTPGFDLNLLMKHVCFILSMSLFLMSCNYIYDKSGINPGIGLIEIHSVPDNALKIKINVQTTKATDVFVTYWKYINDSKEDSVVFYSALSKDNAYHKMILVNLNLNTKYFFRITAKKGTRKKLSRTYSFETTHKLPWVPYFKTTDSLNNVKFDGYIHFHSRHTPGYLLITNGNGELCFYQKNDNIFKVSKWTDKNTLLGILSNDTLQFTNGKEIIEYDIYGDTIFELKTGEKRIEESFHHDIDLDKNGNIMVLVYDKRVVDLSSVGGNRNDTVKGDGVLILNHQGKKVWQWSVFDVMDPLDDKKILKSKNDWLHANSLFEDKDGNFILSFRNISQVWKINRKSGKIIWKLGGIDSDFKIDDEAVFCGQHNVRENALGEIVMLDNGNQRFRPGYVQKMSSDVIFDVNKHSVSRLLTLSLDTVSMTAHISKVVPFPRRYFTHSQGSAEYINDTLVVYCSTNTNRIVFTNNKGKLLGVMPLEYASYREQYIKDLCDTGFVKNN